MHARSRRQVCASWSAPAQDGWLTPEAVTTRRLLLSGESSSPRETCAAVNPLSSRMETGTRRLRVQRPVLTRSVSRVVAGRLLATRATRRPWASTWPRSRTWRRNSEPSAGGVSETSPLRSSAPRRVATIALEECNRSAAGLGPQNRAVRLAKIEPAPASPPAEKQGLGLVADGVEVTGDEADCASGELRVFRVGWNLALLLCWRGYLAITRTLPHPAGAGVARPSWSCCSSSNQSECVVERFRSRVDICRVPIHRVARRWRRPL
jgi:hypothetical protein